MKTISAVTVLGANGTMGSRISGIFASFGDVKVYMVSRDLGRSRQAAASACKSVKADSIDANLVPADYSMIQQCVADSDLVLESVAEDLETKLEVTRLVAPFLQDDTIVCSGTSGLSITTLSEALPKNHRRHYFGAHFFNPPYAMPLCEVVPTEYTDRRMLEEFKFYLGERLIRTVVEVKDSPAFMGNRIGFQFVNQALQYADRYKSNGGIDYIDAILGRFTGRSMAPLVTSDFVGLDVHKAIVDNVYNMTQDYAHDSFVLPTFCANLVSEGKTGKKVNAGLYKREALDSGARKALVYDIDTGSYREKAQYIFPFAEKMIADFRIGDYDGAFKELMDNQSVEAETCLSFLLEYVVYALSVSEAVGDSVRAADDVMAAGFNWCPPLAMIDAMSTVTDFTKLAKERLSPGIQAEVDLDSVLARAERSAYDYRQYFRSAR